MKKDYYEVLGIQKTASESEIKRAYRVCAMKYHPDRNPGDKDAEAKFKEISEAYEVLSDSQKKQMYDRYGHASPINSGFSHTASDPFDFFENIFGFHSFGDFNKSAMGARNITSQIQVDFLEAAKGCVKKVTFQRKTFCSTCGGTGAKDGTRWKKCSVCDGQGRVVMQQGNFRLEKPCDYCRTAGKIIEEHCEDCGGGGQYPELVNLDVNVPAGISSGAKICIKDEGEIGRNGVRGDLYVLVNVNPHEYFGRSGNNLTIDVPIGYTTAALGGDLEIPSLEGFVTAVVPPKTQTGAVLKLKGKGFPDPRRNEIRGDYLVRIHIDVPVEYNEEYRNMLEQLAKFEAEQLSKNIKSFREVIKG